MAQAIVAGMALAGGGALLAWRLRDRLGARREEPEESGSEPEPVTSESADRTAIAVDNGGIPFAVHISYKRCVATLCNVIDYEKPKETNDVIRSFRFRRAFVGLHPKEPEALRAAAAKGDTAAAAALEEAEKGRQIWWWGGNSVLLDLGDHKYVFVGMIVFSFSTDGDEIQSYVSTMGNNAVPYPFAVGSRYTYFMIENTYVHNHILERFSPEERKDPYQPLYFGEIERWLPGADPRVLRPNKRGPGGRYWQKEFPLKDYTVLVSRKW